MTQAKMATKHKLSAPSAAAQATSDATATATPTAAAGLLEMCRSDMLAYGQLVMQLEPARHTVAVCDFAQRVAFHDVRVGVVVMPPRHGKTVVCSQLLPAYYAGRFPTRSVMVVACTQELASDWCRVVRSILMSPEHQAVFSGACLRPGGAADDRLELTAGGVLYFLGRGSTAAGRGCSLLIDDDLVKNQMEAASPTVLHGIIEAVKSVFIPRLTADGRILFVGTRWHLNDPQGWAIRELAAAYGDRFQLLAMPAVAEEGDALGRAPGEALWPARYTREALDLIRASVGPKVWASTYQGKPLQSEGVVFQRTWWKYYDHAPAPAEVKRHIFSLDCAYRRGEENSWSVMQHWAETSAGFYLLLTVRQQMPFPELKRKLTALAAELSPDVILVEDSSAGTAIIEELSAAAGSTLPILPVRADRDKLQRAHAITGLVEAGKVYLPKPETAGWVETFLDELSAFPDGANSDQTDALSQALTYMRRPRAECFGMLDLMRGIGNHSIMHPLDRPALRTPSELTEKPARARARRACPRCKSTRIVALPTPDRRPHCQDCSMEWASGQLEATA